MACSIATHTPLLVVRPPRRSSFPPSTCSLLVENPDRRGNYGKSPSGRKKISRECRAMVQQTEQGPSAAYAKEMERLSAKESLLLALFRSPYLEGRWNFEWFGSGSPGLFAAKFLFERFPQAVANLSKLDVVIKDGYANISASVKLLNSIESGFIISTRLTVEGPLRMKGEYIEGILEYPKFNEASIPQQLRGALDQAASTMQQLPVPIRDAVAGGLKVPLGGTFERLFMISYLDEEILIIRDTAGAPEVLRRLDPGPSQTAQL
ncbi:putative plastid-lipid-associated protein 13, chloroplastic [Sesamum angolense]|uniref:Plastid-lipid-associated protein 13, chloroplastic n=1 Tax=Sesamum angolense TaxID=2727404 RepID=A0AAE2C0V2_9LAMI|nr:putative plastid-lipid-associated protein 13, chloroplastic [Sesamum angolense]